MVSINDWLLDQSISHQINLAGHSNGVVQRIIRLLNRSDDRLYAELNAALERLDPASFTVERLESLLGSVRAVNSAAYAQIGETLKAELQDFASYELSFQNQLLLNAMPVTVHVATVSAETVYAAAMARPMQGLLLKGILGDMEAGRAKKIRQAIAQGFTESRTTDQIIRDLRGTRAKGYADGLMEGSRREIATVTRTALGHMAGFVQDRTTEANTDLIRCVVWSSHIDMRVSKMCFIRDGKQYTPDGHKPIGHSIPWLSGPGRLHYNCRSASTYVMKSYAELGIDIPEVTMKGSTRATLDGQIPKEVKLPEWVMKQSAARQDEMFGPTRGQLLRKGGMKAEELYNVKGQFLDLSQLRERDAAAFAKAGL